MDDKEFTKLINKAVRLANQHRETIAAIDEESKARHGYHPAELDCDEIIDSVKYGTAGKMTASEFDQHMKNAIDYNTDYKGKVRTN